MLLRMSLTDSSFFLSDIDLGSIPANAIAAVVADWQRT